MMAAAHCIYTDEMTSLMHGSPLWEPDCRPHEVSIGDVGYIRQGRFCRLFNVALPSGDARNEFGIPDGFEQLILDERAMTHRHLPPGALVSRFVTNSGADVQFNGSVLQASAGFHFSCKRDRGAALIINSEALRRDSEQLGAFKKYMLKHSNSWLSFANNPPNSRDISLHDLVFVTGRDNTADWAVAAFLDKATSGGVSFQAGYTPVMGASFSVWGNWAGLRSLYANCGPQVQRTAAVGSNILITSNTSNLPGLVCSADMELYDQCVFVRGYKIMDRKSQVYGMMKLKVSANSDGFGWIKAPLFESKTTSTTSDAASTTGSSRLKPKIVSGTSKRDGTGHTRTFSVSTQNSSGVSEKDQLELMYMGESNEISPAEYLLMYILHVSEAELALIHDNDISAVVGACKDYTTFIEALREVSPRVIVDSDGVGSVSIIDDGTTTTPQEFVTENLDLEQIQTDISASQARLMEVRRQLSLLSNTSSVATREDNLRTQIKTLGGNVAKTTPVQSLNDPSELDSQSTFLTRSASLGAFERDLGQKKVNKPPAKKSLSLEDQRTDEGLADKLPKNVSGGLPALKAELDIMRKERIMALSNRSQLLQERDELHRKLRKLQGARRVAVEREKSKEEEEMERKTSDQALKAELIRKEKQMKERQQRLEARARLLERASAPAFEAERRSCNSLLAYFSPMVVSSTNAFTKTPSSSAGKGSITTPSGSEKDNSPGAGWVPLRKKKEREEDFFTGGSKTIKKSSSKATSSPSQLQRSNSSPKKLAIPLTIMTFLEGNGIAIPTTFNDVPDTINEIQKKLQWLDNHETEATASNLAMMEASLQALPLLT